MTGTNNYRGTLSENFTILAPASADAAQLKAEIEWKYLKATGTYFAQLKLTCTNGLAAGIGNLSFRFADRIGTDGTTEACLWNTPSRRANPNTVTDADTTYRVVELDASRIIAENEAVVYGVSNISSSAIPVSERTIEMFVHRRVVPQTGNEGAAKVGDFVGYVSWESGEGTHAVPVVARGSALHVQLQSMKPLSAPLSLQALNTSLAMGAPLSEDSSPYCRLTAFRVADNSISGTVEVGTEIDGLSQKGAVGANTTVTLLGAKSLAGGFAEIGAVQVADDGTFSIEKPDDCSFFKIRIDIVDIVK